MVSAGGGKQFMAARVARLLPTTNKTATHSWVPTVYGAWDFVHDPLNDLHPGVGPEGEKVCAALLDGKCVLHRWVSHFLCFQGGEGSKVIAFLQLFIPQRVQDNV